MLLIKTHITTTKSSDCVVVKAVTLEGDMIVLSTDHDWWNSEKEFTGTRILIDQKRE